MKELRRYRGNARATSVVRTDCTVTQPSRPAVPAVGFMSGGRGLSGWLELVFFGGAELSVLSSPSFAVIVFLQGWYPDAAPLAGLTAIAAGSVAIAAFRGGALDVGAWPRRAELTSLPLRMLYFSLVFFLATMGVAFVAVSLGSLWLTLSGGAVQAAGLASFPSVYQYVHGDPVRKPAQRV